MNGLAIIDRTESGTRGVYIDQDTIECARLNARTKKRIQEAAMRQQMESRKQKHRKEYNRAALKSILLHGGILSASAWALDVGIAHPAICIPVGLYALCAACVRLGAWFGRGRK